MIDCSRESGGQRIEPYAAASVERTTIETQKSKMGLEV